MYASHTPELEMTFRLIHAGSLFIACFTRNNQCTQNSENKEHIDVLLFDQQPVLVGNIPIISDFAPFFAPTARYILPQVCGQHHEI